MRIEEVSGRKVDVDVIREGRRGVFGIGGEDAIVRVTPRDTTAAATAAGPPRQRAPRGDGQRGRDAAQPSAPPSRRSAFAQDEERGEAAPLAESEDTATPASVSAGRRGSDAGSGRGPRAPRGERAPRPGFDRGAPREREPSSGPRGYSDEPILIPDAPAELPSAPATGAEDPIDFAGHTLRDLLTLLGLTETEIVGRDPETPGDGAGLVTQVFDIYGNDEDTRRELGLLIGRRGETLAALQYLLNVTVSGRFEGEHVFGVDIDEYRRRREQTLTEMAHRIAEEVRETGDVITLEPMSAAERRIIHLALQDEEGVTTASVGRGADRQVEVMPEEPES